MTYTHPFFYKSYTEEDLLSLAENRLGVAGVDAVKNLDCYEQGKAIYLLSCGWSCLEVSDNPLKELIDVCEGNENACAYCVDAFYCLDFLGDTVNCLHLMEYMTEEEKKTFKDWYLKDSEGWMDEDASIEEEDEVDVVDSADFFSSEFGCTDAIEFLVNKRQIGSFSYRGRQFWVTGFYMDSEGFYADTETNINYGDAVGSPVRDIWDNAPKMGE